MSMVELATGDEEVVQQKDRIQADPQVLLKALSQVKGFTDRKSTIPVLRCVKLTQHGPVIDLEATDLKNYAKTSVEGVGDCDGSWVLQFDELLGTLQSMKGYKQVDITEEDGKVRIKSATRTISLPFFDPKDWPSVSLTDELDSCLYIDRQVLADAMAWVAIAIGQDKTRHSLCTMCFDVSNSMLTLTATDSYRMHYQSVPLARPTHLNVKYLVNREAIANLVPQIKKYPGEWMIYHDTSREASPAMVFRSPDSRFYVRAALIDADYPDYSELAPDIAHSIMVTVDAGEFFAALKPCQKLARSTDAPVVLTVDPADAVMEVVCSVEDVGESSARLKVVLEADMAKPFRIGFNPIFLGQAVALAKGAFSMCFVDPLRPTFYFADDLSRQGILMPIGLLR